MREKYEADNRLILPAGYQLIHGGKNYTISGYVSAGGNSVVYEAYYQDTLMPEKVHTVLIKELYPYDPLGRITRNDNMDLVVQESARKLFEQHRESFLLGNRVHLTLSVEGKGGIAENLDSFEQNSTVYTILTARKGWVLSELLAKKKEFPALDTVIRCMKNLLQTLALFHEHRLLHLDVSPDNIFMLEPRNAQEFPVEMLLLDFNSVYSLDHPEIYIDGYYPGKPGYMAPEASLHKYDELGPWTDLYSATAVFYCLLTSDKPLTDIELSREKEIISPYSRLLLHEKEVTAEQVNRILRKGFRTMPHDRYQNTAEMLADIQELEEILAGTIRIPVRRQDERTEDTGKMQKAGRVPRRKWLARGAAAAGALLIAAGAFYGGRISYQAETEMAGENTELDLSKFPIETDDSVVLTQQDVRYPLADRSYMMDVQVQTSTAVRIMLKDYEHKRDTSEVIDTYSLFTFYTGENDKRGWQNADLTYDFFYTEDNTLHMELPFQDPNHFNLDYVGVIFQNFNYDESQLVLDITRCTLVDGEGNEYDMTDLIGSHLLFFDEERWQQNLITTQNRDYVKTFDDIRGGQLIVDAQVGYLDPLLEVTWESEDPEIATVDERGRVQGLRQGITTLTVTIRDKETGEERSTQMLVNVISKL